MKEPAHKIFIDRYLNWDLVKERLARYKYINKYFPLDILKKCSSKPPLYSHFLSWRLGTWQSEGLFEFFDTLLAYGAKLPNWNTKKVPKECEFERFWSFIWELQVAKLFSNYPETIIEWTDSGPDLSIRSIDGQFFVECTVYLKFFGLEEFINELLGHIDPRIEVTHKLFIECSLPNNAIEPFLDELFKPFLNDGFLQEKIKESERISPISLPMPSSAKNLYILIRNDNATASNPDQPWTQTGSPEDFLNNMMEEILEKKRKSNRMGSYRPNVLAVNCCLVRDFQTATALGRSLPMPELGKKIDSVLLTPCGIDRIPSLDSNRFICLHDNHPIKSFLNL